jgi:DNA-binding MarR family transcriptional regulator
MSPNQRQVLLEEVGRATQAYQRATDGFDDAVGRHLNLNPADLRGLDWLTEGPMSAGELSEATGLSTAATTTLLDRLEEKGYIRRERDPEDRRRIRAELTDEGRKKLGALYGPLAIQGGRLLSGFTDRDLEKMRDFLVEATQVVHIEEAKLRASTKS